MSQINVNSLLTQMRQLSSQIDSREVVPTDAPGQAPQADFGTLLKQSIASVANSQLDAGNKANAFERGDPGADLGSTMVAINKASLSLNALTQVRNKLTDAYSDIMNMQM
jgi:flagellar hook-basal body complex protein FliE